MKRLGAAGRAAMLGLTIALTPSTDVKAHPEIENARHFFAESGQLEEEGRTIKVGADALNDAQLSNLTAFTYQLGYVLAESLKNLHREARNIEDSKKNPLVWGIVELDYETIRDITAASRMFQRSGENAANFLEQNGKMVIEVSIETGPNASENAYFRITAFDQDGNPSKIFDNSAYYQGKINVQTLRTVPYSVKVK